MVGEMQSAGFLFRAEFYYRDRKPVLCILAVLNRDEGRRKHGKCFDKTRGTHSQ